MYHPLVRRRIRWRSQKFIHFIYEIPDKINVPTWTPIEDQSNKMDLDQLQWSHFIQLHRFIPLQQEDLVKINLVAKSRQNAKVAQASLGQGSCNDDFLTQSLIGWKYPCLRNGANQQRDQTNDVNTRHTCQAKSLIGWKALESRLLRRRGSPRDVY